MNRAPAHVLRLWEEPLAPEEFQQRLDRARAELAGEEGERVRELIAWFVRRYPTPRDRLRYNRKHRIGRPSADAPPLNVEPPARTSESQR